MDPVVIRIEWRRTWQTKPYESETAVLSMTDTYNARATAPTDRAKEVALVERGMYAELAKVGDQIMAARIAGRV